jgi:hypothetical protein
VSTWSLADVGEVYRAAWCPRTDAKAEWSVQGEHWYAVREPLTVPRILDGLRKVRPPVSAYMDDREGNTHVLAIDFDRDDGLDLGYRMAKVARDDGAYLYVERSRRGCHVWGTTEVLSGDVMRRALRYWVGRVSAEAARDPKTEIMPMAVQRGPDTVGHSLRLPMMPHQRTGERHPLCDPDGKPLGKTLGETMMAVCETPAQVVRDAAAKGPPSPVNLHSLPPEVRPPRRLRADEMPSASDLLREHWGVLNAAPGRTVRCPVHPSPDRHPSLSISRDDERVWCHAPECEWYAPEGLGQIQGIGSLRLAKLAEIRH